MSEKQFFGCLDSSCEIQKPRGQHTNGGCKCLSDIQPFSTRSRVTQGVRALHERIAELEGQLNAATEWLETILDESWDLREYNTPENNFQLSILIQPTTTEKKG